MPATRLVRIGNSLGLIVPKRFLDSLSWWQSDTLYIDNENGKIVIYNMTNRVIQPFHAKPEYGDAVSRKA